MMKQRKHRLEAYKFASQAMNKQAFEDSPLSIPIHQSFEQQSPNKKNLNSSIGDKQQQTITFRYSELMTAKIVCSTKK